VSSVAEDVAICPFRPWPSKVLQELCKPAIHGFRGTTKPGALGKREIIAVFVAIASPFTWRTPEDAA
jgi:hypothetical protein